MECDLKAKSVKIVILIRGNFMSVKVILLLRNSFFNFIGQFVPLLAGVICIPGIVHLLGQDRFGVMAMVWMILNYFTLFDFGLGRATTKFIADCLERNDRTMLCSIFWTSLFGQALLGLLAAFLLASIAPYLVERVFRIPVALFTEARQTFYILACCLPAIIINNGLRSVLGGGQRFDLINMVSLPVYTMNFIIPLIALHAGSKLPGVVVIMGLLTAMSGFIYLFFCLKIFPESRRLSINRETLKYLLTFGGWITVSNFIGPVLVYLDRFLIGAFLSVAAVGYYTAPYEVITRLWIFPASLVNSLFPAFSAMEAGGARGTMTTMYSRSLKYLLLIMGPVVFIVILFARDVLLLWLGGDFAAKSTLVFQILAMGVLINSLGQVPFALIQGAGRPDITAKFHLLELPLYIGLLWLFLLHAGIEGAAMAWTIRVTIDALFLLIVSGWLFKCWAEKRFSMVGGLVLLLTGLAFFAGGFEHLAWKITTGIFGLTVLFAVGWWLALDERERAWLRSTLYGFWFAKRYNGREAIRENG